MMTPDFEGPPTAFEWLEARQRDNDALRRVPPMRSEREVAAERAARTTRWSDPMPHHGMAMIGCGCGACRAVMIFAVPSGTRPHAIGNLHCYMCGSKFLALMPQAAIPRLT